jgi:hypothetical protein
MAGSQARTCSNCGDQCPSSAMCPWGKSSWSCHICKTNYNRRTEQNSKDGKLKDHWKAMSKEEKQDWFKKNKAAYEPNKRHAYDNPGEYVDSNLKGSRHNSDSVYKWLPCDDWIIRQKMLGKCGGGTPEQQYSKGLDLYKEAVLDKTVAKKFEHGQWLIGIYGGLEERVGSFSEVNQQWKRRKTIHDQVDQSACTELAEEAERVAKLWQERTQHAMGSNVVATCAVPDLPPGLARAPELLSLPRAEAADDICREVLMNQQRQQVIEDLEEQDAHEASEARKIQKAAEAARGAGRPKKLRSELLADVSRMIRDRGSHIADAIAKIENSRESVVEEFKAQLGTFPKDVKDVETSMRADVAEKIAKMSKAKEKLGEIKPATLVDENDCDAEKVRKAVVEETKEAFKTYAAEANKAISAFKLVAKKAVVEKARAEKKRCSRGQQGPDSVSTPALAKGLKEKLTKSVEGSEFVIMLEMASLPPISGLTPCKVPAPAALGEQLKNHAGAKSHAKWLWKQVGKEGAATAAMSVYRPQVAKKVAGLVKSACGPLVCRVPLPAEYESLHEEIFSPQCWVVSERHMHISPTPYGVGEVRYLLEGTYKLAGVLLSKMPGQTLKEKFDKVSGTAAGMESFLAKAAGSEVQTDASPKPGT